MTRGAKIVVFSVVGLFVLAGIYYGFMAPTTPTEPISDSTPQVIESPTLTMTPAIDGQPLNGMGNALPEIGGTATGNTTGTTAGTMTANPNGWPASTGPAFAPSTGGPIGTPAVVTQNPAFPSEVQPTTSGAIVKNSPTLTPTAPAPTAPTTPAKKVVTAKAKTSSYTVYTVETGDTLTAIAGTWFKDTSKWKEIVAVNPGLSASNLKVGQKINLPAKSGSSSTKVSSATKSSAPTVTAENQHVVTAGETLASISDKAYGNRTNWKKIYDANKSVIGENPSTLKVGMKLTIPAKG
ncbi:MAG: LysM peptidoglycan-binding domain-containing protein [Planctomycetota bacterium]